MANSEGTLAKKILEALMVAAIIGVVAYIWNIWDKRRMDALVVTTEQIEKLYGPVSSIAQANTLIWEALPEQTGAHGCGPKIEEWRGWMRSVFQPQNEQMEQTILNNRHLLQDGEMHPVFNQLIEHTEAYKGIIAAWSYKNPDTPSTTWIKYPVTLEKCVTKIYDQLVARQDALQRMWFPASSPTVSIPAECSKIDARQQSICQ